MLTNVLIRNAKPKDKLYRIADGKGLNLEVPPDGAKRWRFRYRFGGKQKMISLGTYPEVSLKTARERLDAARKSLADGVDPSQIRKAEKAARSEIENTFEAVAREWIEQRSTFWAERHTAEVSRKLEYDAYPTIGARPVSEIDAPEILALLRRIENRGARETAHRVREHIGQVIRYAVATGRAKRDPTGDLRGALAPVKPRNFAALTGAEDFANLLRGIDNYSGSSVVRCALRLAPLVATRPGELRRAEWVEVNLEQAEWRIPAAKTKQRRPHIVPLSRQAAGVLEEIRPLTGNSRYVFPSNRSFVKPMSENTLNAAMRSMGFTKTEMTAHGFRSVFSTTLHELGWPSHLIEKQLGHVERNRVKAAYDHSAHLKERREMMQSWADHLDSLKSGADVVPIRRAKKDG